MKASPAEMAGKDCVKVAVRVRPFNKVSIAVLYGHKAPFKYVVSG